MSILTDPDITPQGVSPQQLADSLRAAQRNFEAIERRFPLGTSQDVAGPKPFAELQRKTAGTLPNDVWTLLTYDGEATDRAAGGEDQDTGDGTLTCRVSGVYVITGAVTIAASGPSALKAARLVRNGGTVLATLGIPDPASYYPTSFTPSAVVELHRGDTVGLEAYQNSGGSLAVKGTDDNEATALRWSWMGP